MNATRSDAVRTTVQPRQRCLVHAIAVFCLLTAVYFCTFAGQILSTDELRLVDAAHSFVKFGNLELSYSNSLRNYVTLPDNIINLSLDSEPMQVYVSAPLMWLATKLQGIGLIHATWLLNVLVTALTGSLLFLYGRLLGYTDREALMMALLYAIGTYAWVYSQLYFREPLFTFFALLSAYALENWRFKFKQRRFSLHWLLLAILGLVCAWLTKEAGVFLLPTLLLIALPAINKRWIAIFLLLTGLLAAGLFVYVSIYPANRIASTINAVTNVDLTYFGEAVAAYLLSPGFSIWVFSPVLLLGIGGAILAWHRRQWRLVIIPLIMLLTYVLGYAALRGGDWYSGLGWGARYLLPVIPFLSLWLLPVMHWFTSSGITTITAQHHRKLIWRAIIIGIVAHSVMTQIISVTTPIKAFSNYLGDESAALGREVVAWRDGTWNLVYIPHFVNAHQSNAPTEIAWMVTGAQTVVLPLCGLLAGVALLVLFPGRPFPTSMHKFAEGLGNRLIHRRHSPGFGLTVFAMALLLILMLYLGLRAVYVDPRFGADSPSLWTALETIDGDLRPANDAIILDNHTYRPFFMNYYRGDAPIFVLPNPPGEILVPGHPPEVISDLPEEQAHPYTQVMLARIAKVTTRWWYLTEYTPYSVERKRSTEHYLVRHYYAGNTVVNLPDLRLIQYSSNSAPPDTIPPLPLHSTDVDFGAARLVGYDVPQRPWKTGELLNLSLLWRHDGWTQGVEPFDYSVNVSLVDSQGRVWAQRAEVPVGSFGLMSTWQKGGYYRDNVALALPRNLPGGEYELWVLIFDWRDNHPLREPYTLTRVIVQ